MADILGAYLPAWIAVAIGAIALTVAYFALRRPATNITFGKKWFVGYDHRGKLRVRGSVAITPRGPSFVIMEHGCEVRIGKLKIDLAPQSDFSGAVTHGGKVVPLHFEDESEGEDVWKSRIKLDVWIRLDDGSKKHFRKKFSLGDTDITEGKLLG
jgi:hypothetical protein